MKYLIAFKQYQQERIKELEEEGIASDFVGTIPFTAAQRHENVLAGIRAEIAKLPSKWNTLLTELKEKNVQDLRNKPDKNSANNNGGSTDYYKLPSNAVDLQDLIEHKEMSFALGNIFKAVYRLGSQSHSSKERDLNKIIYFAERELERLNG